ncbi:hypothetical protein A7U43_28430 (plasmid) [Mycobacterium adipatum]|uniref:Uncharacterized protein n=1 Tax=Mycobacterium adipatum TaxID=1682113 RepID=A0A172UWI3_9MYCO|nr:hypothetical protein [Mycobacterium adipatum]ANE83442.1 hypothetical protein A7U43_28430 [Mycobacterium adipatum]
MNVTGRKAGLFNGPALWNGLTLGPLGTASALLMMMTVDTPHTSAPVLTALIAPTAIFLILVLISLVRGGKTSWWLFSALGAVLGTTLLVAAILGTLTGIAWMLSDPG